MNTLLPKPKSKYGSSLGLGLGASPGLLPQYLNKKSGRSRALRFGIGGSLQLHPSSPVLNFNISSYLAQAPITNYQKQICTPFNVKLPTSLKSKKLPFPGIRRIWKKVDSSEDAQRKMVSKWGFEIDHGKTKRIRTTAMKGLIAITLKSKHAEVRKIAMSFLALRRQAVPYLKRIVASRCSPTIKLRALKALAGAGYGIKRMRKKMKPFMDLLYHDDFNVRQKAIDKVAVAKPDLAVPVLFAAIKASNGRVGESAEQALVKMGVKSMSGFLSILRMFGDQDCENKHAALAVLKQVLGNPKQHGIRHKIALALPVLEGALRGSDNKAATVALKTFIAISKVAKHQVTRILKNNMSSLIRLVKEGTKEQVSTAALCLTIVPDPKAARALVNVLTKSHDSSDLFTRSMMRHYIKSLQQYKKMMQGHGRPTGPGVKVPSAPLKLSFINVPPKHVHEALVKIASASDDGFRSVIEAIDKHDKRKLLFVRKLEIIRDVCKGKKKLTPFVTYVALNSASIHMKSDNPKFRKLAVEILDKVKTKRSVDLLIKGLGDDDPRVRQMCIGVLAKFKITRAVPRLMEIASRDPVKEVRDAANRALDGIGQKDPGYRATWL